MARKLIVSIFLAFGSFAYGDSWHGNDAQLLATGTLVSVNGDSIQIQSSDNSTSDVRIDSLSLGDRAAILDRSNDLSEFKHPVRRWNSSGGTYHVDAKIISFNDTTARLVLPDNKVAIVPIDKLSSDDRDYLDRVKKLITSREINPFVTEKPNGPIQSLLGATPRTTTSQLPSSKRITTNKPIDPGFNNPPVATSTLPTSPISDPARNPNSETATGYTATGIPQFTGPRGGTYHYSKNGNKVYDKHK